MKRSYLVRLPVAKGAQERLRLEVASLGDGRYEVSTGSETRVIDARPLVANGRTMGLSLIERRERDGAGGRQIFVDIEGSLPDYKITPCGGDTIALKLEDERGAQAAEGAAPGGGAASGMVAVSAPMPGKVVKVLCQVGQRIKQGQGLLVVEAMKMENELRAPCDGLVRALAVAEGQTVDGSVTLVHLEAAP